jgi:tryptophan-rich sensory protein
MTLFTKQKQIAGLLSWMLICFTASAIGAVASIQARSFYGLLIQPAWSPPAWVFGPVWTTLYTLMAIAAWQVWRHGGFRSNKKPLTLFLVQLAFNALWSWVFFAWHLGGAALLNVVILWVLIAASIISFWRTSPLAGALLIPYFLWVSFAAALNYSLWQLNPLVLGQL